MTGQSCPECGRGLAAADVNIAEGVALCPECGKLSRLGEVVDEDRPDEVELDTVPRGCGIEEYGRGGVHIRATMRSLGTAVGALAIAAFWNGIVSVFVVVAIAGLWANLVGPVPEWFPAPDMNGSPMSLGMTLFLCLFLTPFVLIGTAMIGAVLASVFGRIDVRIDGDGGSVRTGIGPIGWTRRFDPKRVTKVAMGETSWQENGRSKPLIRIEADRTIKVGSTLTQTRREWLRAVLHVLLVTPNSPRRARILSQATRSRQAY